MRQKEFAVSSKVGWCGVWLRMKNEGQASSDPGRYQPNCLVVQLELDSASFLQWIHQNLALSLSDHGR